MRTMRLLCLCALALLAAGCASERRSVTAMPGSQNAILDSARGAEENAELYTDLIRRLIEQERLYAALAHLESREREFGVTDELRLLRADILRRMGDYGAAQALYEPLLDGPLAGPANHGLGLIRVREDISAGTDHLERAVALMPTDARMRNDLGYALLQQSRIGEARRQLTTAYELDRGNRLSRNNFILLLLIEGRDAQAARIAADNQIDTQTLARLRDQARRFGQGDGAAIPIDDARPSDARRRLPSSPRSRRATTPVATPGGGPSAASARSPADRSRPSRRETTPVVGGGGG